MKAIIRNYALVLFLLASFAALSQENYRLKVTFDNAEPEKSLKFKTMFADTLQRNSEIDKIISLLQFKGYLLATATKQNLTKEDLILKITAGPQFQLTGISSGNANQGFLAQSGFRERIFRNLPFNPDQLTSLFHSLLEVYENNGYPFASVGLDSVKLESNSIAASLNVQPNALFVMDSVLIAGNVKVSKTYLQTYLQIKKGSLYNEQIIGQIDDRLRELAFLKPVKPAEITFAGNKARATLFLEKKTANQFDGIIGFQPNSSTGKFEVVGDIMLQLQNAFKRAEKFAFNYKGLPNQTRELTAGLDIPNVFSTALSAGAEFNLFKQDTTFQNISRKLNVGYSFGGNNSLKFFLEQKSGNLISTSQYQQSTSIPQFSDVSTTAYGLSLNLERLDYRLNPTKGFSLFADVSAGNRTVKKNSGIDPALYDGLNLRSSQYHVDLIAAKYFPVSKRGVFVLSDQSGLIIGKSLYANELFRIGGFRTLRGFDEQSIFTDRFTVLNAEYRFLLEQNSFLFAFVNQGFASVFTANGYHADQPLGLGAGINFETRSGIVSLTYAVGKQQNNQLNLQRGKIHLGLVALF